ncbi:dicarboxylate/amino acid:cation symporter, partial [Caulobacter sp. D4A]
MDEPRFVGHKGGNAQIRSEWRRGLSRASFLHKPAVDADGPRGPGMNKRFAYLIIGAMVLGVLVGWGC